MNPFGLSSNQPAPWLEYELTGLSQRFLLYTLYQEAHPAKTKLPHLDAIQLEKGTSQKIFELIVTVLELISSLPISTYLDNAGVLERLESSTEK